MTFTQPLISAAELIVFITLGVLIYTYLVYPVTVLVAAKLSRKKATADTTKDLPSVSVLMAVHNEASVLRKKIDRLIASTYPQELLEIIIGSDNSTDETDSILEQLNAEHPGLKIIKFSHRQGKPAIINSLAAMASGEILIITDANVFPEPGTLNELLKTFSDSDIALADTRLAGTRKKSHGVALPGEAYINLETRLKHAEGKLFGLTMGPFGGFYAVRKSHYIQNTKNALADDFRICMNVLEKGGKAVVNTEAVVYEDITDDIGEEFRRKTRISAGNFQNLVHFSHLFLKPWKKLFLIFFSHKVLRWITPFIWLTMVISLTILQGQCIFFRWLMILQLIFIILPPLDLMLKTIKVNIVPLRFVTHFSLMNAALFIGLFRFGRGVKDGTWEPTKREL